MTITQDTLISIYDAALSDKNWGRALDACKLAVGAQGAMLYQFSSINNVKFAIEETSSDFAEVEHLLSEYNQLIADGRGSNYDQEGLGFVHSTPQFAVTLDQNIWTLDAHYSARPEVEIGLRAGWLRRSFVNLSNDPVTLSGLVFLYGRQCDEDIPPGVGKAGPLVAPHVSKAAEIYRFTDGLRQKYDAVLSVLDKISTGVFLVSESGDIIVENRAAKRLLDTQDGLTKSTDGKLTSRDDTAGAALKFCISDVSSTAKGEGDKSGDAVQVPRRGANPPLVAVVSPLRDVEMEIEKGLVGALITIVDPLEPVHLQSDFVAKAYGLSKAESRVAGLVLQGLSNLEISDRLGVSPETIKSQVSSVLTKSGCRSRVAFIWRVFQIAPPIK